MPEDTPETRRRRAVAKLLGLAIVNGEPVREKNNVELAAEKAAKKAAEEKIHPTLFDKPSDSEEKTSSELEAPIKNPSMSEIYAERIDNERADKAYHRAPFFFLGHGDGDDERKQKVRHRAERSYTRQKRRLRYRKKDDEEGEYRGFRDFLSVY